VNIWGAIVLETVFFDSQLRHCIRREQLYESGCGADDSHIDAPRLRTVTHWGYLASGVRYDKVDESSNAVNAERTRLRSKAANINLVQLVDLARDHE
jgi:hypothetical protein